MKGPHWLGLLVVVIVVYYLGAHYPTAIPYIGTS